MGMDETAERQPRREEESAGFDQRREGVVIGRKPTFQHINVTEDGGNWVLCLDIASDHGVVHESVAVCDATEDRACIGEEGSIAGDCSSREEAADGKWVSGQGVGFDQMGVEFLELL